MKIKTAKTIVGIWNNIEASEPDISDEQLFARTSDTATRLFGWDVDNGHVGEALSIVHEIEQAKA